MIAWAISWFVYAAISLGVRIFDVPVPGWLYLAAVLVYFPIAFVCLVRVIRRAYPRQER